jgi:hypothetical protein
MCRNRKDRNKYRYDRKLAVARASSTILYTSRTLGHGVPLFHAALNWVATAKEYTYTSENEITRGLIVPTFVEGGMATRCFQEENRVVGLFSYGRAVFAQV